MKNLKKIDILNILERITIYYPSYKIFDLERTTEAWYEVLQDADAKRVKSNLDEHIKTSKFAPTIADLLKVPEIIGRTIPSVEETTKIINNVLQIENRSDTLTNKAIENAKAEARRLLGMEGGESND